MWLLLALVLSDPPITHRVIVAPAETLTVTVQGAGPAVAFVPGLFGSAYGFRRVTAGLAALGHQAIVIEPLGVGTSARPAGADYTLAAQAARVAAVLDTLGVRRAVVVAHSIGGGIAFRLALLRPDLVGGIVSLEGGPTEHAASGGLRLAMRFAGLIRTFSGPGMLRGEVARNLRASSGDPRWITDSVIDGYTAGPARDFGASIDALRGMADAKEPWALGPRLTEITVPVRLLLGGAKHKSGPSEAERAQLAETLGDYRAETFPGVGHFLHEEAPDAVVAAVCRLTGTGVALERGR